MPGFFNHIIKIPRESLPEMSFNYQDGRHLELIGLRVLRFKEAFEMLKKLDKSLLAGMALCAAAYVADYILPFAMPSAILGAGVAGYCLGRRPACFMQYKEALEDLKDAYCWAMGKEASDKWYAIRTAPVQAMILTLGPWVSKEIIHSWESSDLKNGYLNSAKLKPDFIKKITSFAEGEQYNNWQYCFYGDKGIGNFEEDFLSCWKQLKTLAVPAVAVAELLAPKQ